MTMLKVAHCSGCGQVYQKNIRNLCQDCCRSLDDELDRCESYLRRNRRATTEQLREATGVPVKKITAFLKENRLHLASYPNLTYPCNSCQAPIRQHHLCCSCRVRIITDLHILMEQEAKKAPRPSAFQIRNAAYR
ncbi:flagellar protein [Paenibacillus mucilaginosus]|uniref:Flagellar protein n=1 Tax=Paenibacillus mucilaginosus (strain KNP414) TaxID=1036673 RepID=F8F8C4_PAEMK|nr:flagellar protein [Paenibacillus mucilaginosus]AEI41271.1 flagellar protein [Paenibacillus mucilaginosus KNP414]MCG7211307.1 flagellar protein [Paenibacillus mucilaginosus]WDM30303.1 flagellar protein [Paenibacillus mucilaginosus]